MARNRWTEPKIVLLPDDYRPGDVEPPIAVNYEGFTVLVRFREVAGRLEVWSLEVTGTPSRSKTPRRITASNLRFRWADIIRKAAESYLMNTHADALHPINEADLEQMNPARREAKALGFKLDDVRQVSPKEQQAIEAARKKLPVAVKAFEEMNRGRPQAHDPEVVAEIYRTAFAVGLNPTKAVAEHLGITPTAAGKQVERARKKGVLEPAPRPGVPGLAKRKARKKR